MLKPILAKACHPGPHPPFAPEKRSRLEDHYQAIQDEVRKLLRMLKIPAQKEQQQIVDMGSIRAWRTRLTRELHANCKEA